MTSFARSAVNGCSNHFWARDSSTKREDPRWAQTLKVLSRSTVHPAFKDVSRGSNAGNPLSANFPLRAFSYNLFPIKVMRSEPLWSKQIVAQTHWRPSWTSSQKGIKSKHGYCKNWANHLDSIVDHLTVITTYYLVMMMIMMMMMTMMMMGIVEGQWAPKRAR